MSEQLLDDSGQPITLGQRIGTGGEGSVFALASHPDLVAKIYTTTPSPTQVLRLRALVANKSEAISQVAAWPAGLLWDRQRTCKGFVMQRMVDFEGLYRLATPQLRLERFPTADFRFLARAAKNTAAAFGAIHNAGIVVGDVNQRNTMVSDRALACLVDCDSYQVATAGQTIRCTVGVQEFTPPELQTLGTFATIDRTSNHDRFGIAVLIFQLLFLGRHPFMGMTGTADIELGDAIRRYMFAYSTRSRGMTPPPRTLPFSVAGPVVSDLFEQAFGIDGATGQRPAATEWYRALGEFESALVSCAKSKAHYYPRWTGDCPFCKLAAQGALMFVEPGVALPIANDVDAAMQQLARLTFAPWEPLASTMPVGTPSRIPWSWRWRAIAATAALVAGFSAGVGVLVAFSNSRGDLAFAVGVLVWICIAARKSLLMGRWSGGKGAYSNAVTAAQGQWKHLVERHRAAESSLRQRALQVRMAVETARRQLSNWATVERAAMDKLNSSARNIQLTQYLERFDLTNAPLAGIGVGLKSRLVGSGISTAADVSRHGVLSVDGIGHGRATALTQWRAMHEARFRFDPTLPMDRGAVMRMQQELQRQRAAVANSIVSGVRDLKTIHAEAARVRQGIEGESARIIEQVQKLRPS